MMIGLWSKATWQLPLGNCVHRIRTRGDFLRNEDTAWSRRNQLDGLDFVWDVHETAFEKFFMALRIYAKLNELSRKRHINTTNGGIGNKRALRIPNMFVVPSGNILNDGRRNPWPESLWDYPLGSKCVAIRQKELYIKDHPDRRKALQKLGFQLSGNATLGWLNIMHAAAIYSKMHGRVLDVPINFVVPSPPRSMDEAGSIGGESLPDDIEDAWPWPEQLWGFALGQRLKDIRLKGAHLKNAKSANARRAQLDALGFVWEPKRGRRKRCLGGGGN
jgi:hypothetical protein